MTTTTTESEAPDVRRLSPLKEFGAEIAQRILRLQATLGKTSEATATLARLRNSVGREPGSVPAIWELTTARLPGQVHGDDPTPQERAAHVTLTLYAMHQQGRSMPMHARGPGFGQAVRKLATGSRENAVRRRLDAAATATTITEVAHHLRGLIKQLRSASLQLDYGRLADDLLTFQRAGGPDAVRRRWGRQYYLTDPHQTDQAAAENTEDEPEETP